VTSAPHTLSGRPTTAPRGGLREEVRLAVEPDAETTPAAPEPLVDLTAAASPAAKAVEAAYVQQLEARAEKEADVRAKEQVDAAATEGGIVADVAGDLSESPEAKPTPEAEAAMASEDRPKPIARTLTAKHFETALDEIRPSSSEEGTLPELRKVSLKAQDAARDRDSRSLMFMFMFMFMFVY
jgi:hypothetical protein